LASNKLFRPQLLAGFVFLVLIFCKVKRNRRYIHFATPDFLLILVALPNFMRPSLRKGAYADLSSASWQEIRVRSGPTARRGRRDDNFVATNDPARLFNHQTDHRGQAGVMLGQTDIEPDNSPSLTKRKKRTSGPEGLIGSECVCPG
jgi:hypothetical protein